MFNFTRHKNTPIGVSMLNKSADTVVAVFVDKTCNRCVVAHQKANDRVVVATRRQ